jgi:predicted  nucleic acid-binding Zn-ribbon protein
VAVALASAAAGAAAQTLYKHVMPDGRVIYSDVPMKDAKESKTLEPPPPPLEPDRKEAERRASKAKGERDALDKRLKDRSRKLDDADARVARARQAIVDAEAALERGREPLPGERAGNVGPTSRLREEYFVRVQGLERNVQAAREELDAALKARNDAR